MTTRRTLARTVSPAAVLGLATLLTYAAPAAAPADIPDAIKVPQGEKLVLATHASGSQIYVCTEAGGGKSQWTLKAPDAELRDDKGVLVIHHFAGPAWKHNDGSEVTGKAVARAAPDADSIPWLLLEAVSHEGNGVLTHVVNIQRIHTHGGQPPPAAECNASRQNAEVRVPYTADYYFYAPP